MSQLIWYNRHPLLKTIYKAKKSTIRRVKNAIDRIYYRHNVSTSMRAAKRTIKPGDESYDSYLRAQLEETLRKKSVWGRRKQHVLPLIDMLASKYDVAGKTVLCVGCRNTDEIKYFQAKGAAKVVGIDLYDAGPGVLIMDMHDLKFPDSTYDVVYSRHSFEHSHDKFLAGREMTRVAKEGGVVVIEVPGKHLGGGDFTRFDSIEDVAESFEPRIGDVLWREYSRKEDNSDKMDIIRLMFRVTKA